MRQRFNRLSPETAPAAGAPLDRAGRFALPRPMSPPRELAANLLSCLRFYSRLPVPAFTFEPDPHGMPDFARAIRMLPVAGALIAAPAALTLAAALFAGLPAGVAAALALGAGVLTTGAFHEDGLADTADGFGGGATRERKLDIMKDSRIGTYGGAALALSFLIRWAALTALADSPARAAAIMLACGAATRVFALLPMALLGPARTEGAAFAAARPRAGSLATAFALAGAAGLAPVFAGAGLLQSLAATGLALAAAAAMTGISARQIGGQTGDVAGAAQQLAEMAFLCVFSARV